jgi:hypothetical protein
MGAIKCGHPSSPSSPGLHAERHREEESPVAAIATSLRHMRVSSMATAARKGSSCRSAQVQAAAAVTVAVLFLTVSAAGGAAAATPRRLLVDTDMDTDDLLGLLYLLKQNRSEIDVKVGVTLPSIVLVLRVPRVNLRVDPLLFDL